MPGSFAGPFGANFATGRPESCTRRRKQHDRRQTMDHTVIAGREVSLRAPGVPLKGILGLPPRAYGVVLFAHGSGSGRLSPRNNFVARHLQEAGLATLLLDLLTEREAGDRALVFDVDLLAERLLSATDWVEQRPETRGLRVGYFGASTGAAAAVQAAARAGTRIGAIVSRGGRPDLALGYLPQVQAPTLLIVGQRDEPVLELNRQAHALLRGPKELVVVPGATHLFEEPGALEQVADLAAHWFTRWLAHPGGAPPTTS
ncbi:MAG: dienelactone hydrolase family protein [Chloroflexi bacterium]|nr:dienelactone hydrolase family protein [Chloroflexota bacterium]